MADVRISATMRNYVVVILALVSFLNFIDRQILTILLEAVKLDLGVSDTAMGLLSGTTFAVFYALASIPLAQWADRGRRKTILAGAVALWSGLTALCGLAHTMLQLAVARAGVATAESAAVPISHSLVADLFPPERRATIFGLLMAAGSLGIAAGLFLGGWANTAFGWRGAFVVVGLPGVVLAALIWLTVPEPLRVADRVQGDRSSTLKALLANPLYRWLLALAAMGSLLTYSKLGWSPTFMIRIHGMTTTQIGLQLGLATGIGNAAGHLFTGAISDRLATRDLRWYAWFPALATLATFPSGAVFLYASDPTVAIIGFGFLTFFSSAWLMPLYAIAYRICDSKARAQASAMIAATMSLIGLGLGPLSVGMLNDVLTPAYGAEAIRYSLTAIVCCNVLLIAGFCMIFRRVGRLAVQGAGAGAPLPSEPIVTA